MQQVNASNQLKNHSLPTNWFYGCLAGKWPLLVDALCVIKNEAHHRTIQDTYKIIEIHHITDSITSSC